MKASRDLNERRGEARYEQRVWFPVWVEFAVVLRHRCQCPLLPSLLPVVLVGESIAALDDPAPFSRYEND